MLSWWRKINFENSYTLYVSIIWFWNIGYSIFLFLFVSRCVCWSAGYFLEQSCWLLYNELSNLELFDLETEVAQLNSDETVFYLLGYYQYPLDLVARIEPNLILTAFMWNYRRPIEFNIVHSLRIFLRWYSVNFIMFYNPWFCHVIAKILY